MTSKLRGKSAKELEEIRRLKMLVSGPSGTGKSSLVASFPRAYIIDTELGMAHYPDLLESSGARILQTADPKTVIEEVRTLLAEDHDYLTFAIDPVTNLWHEELEQAEAVVGDSYGKHYGEAGKNTRRLVQLLLRLDMNIVFTAHEKPIYAVGGSTIDTTFDGWKKSDYFFDLWLKTDKRELITGAGRRVVFSAKVQKTRLKGFPPLSEFNLGEYDSQGNQNMYSYRAVAERFNREALEAAPQKIVLSTPEQVAEARELVEKVNPSGEYMQKVYKFAGAEDLRDFSSDHITRFIQKLKEMKGL